MDSESSAAPSPTPYLDRIVNKAISPDNTRLTKHVKIEESVQKPVQEPVQEPIKRTCKEILAEKEKTRKEIHELQQKLDTLDKELAEDLHRLLTSGASSSS
jgi:prefoldin subunit 5